jgi:hypothetical protein
MLSKAALERLPSESIPMPNQTWRLRCCLTKLRRRSWPVRALVLFVSMRCQNACAIIAAPSNIPVADLLALIPLFPFGAATFAI